LSRKRELVARVEECGFCDLSSDTFCHRHQGMIEELPTEYVVRCIGCGEIFTEVPKKGRVNCRNCGKTLKNPRGENQR